MVTSSGNAKPNDVTGVAVWRRELLEGDQWMQMTLPALLLQTADHYAELPAVLYPGKPPITFGGLLARATDFARRLKQAAPGARRVAISSPATTDTVVAHLGALLVDAHTVPLNPTLKASELSYQLRLTAPDAVVAPVRSSKFDCQALIDEALAELPAQPVRIASDPRHSQGDWRWPDLPISQAPLPATRAMPREIAHLLFTSGSTSAPKPAMLTHQGVIGSAVYRAQSFDLHAGDGVCNLLALFHTGGLVAALYTCIAAGIPMWINETFSPEAVLEDAERYGLTVLLGFNTAMDQVLNHRRAREFDLRSLTKAATAPPGPFYDVLKERGFTLIASCYELTEGSNMVSCTLPEDSEHVRRNTVGHPMPGTEIAVFDPDDHGRMLPPGETGEIAFRGWNRMLGYLGADVPLAEADWFFTGDRGRIEDGRVFYDGRYKEMIKTGGENVSPLEVEIKINELFPGSIANAQIIGLPDKRWGERVTAVVQLAEGAALTSDAIIAGCKRELAGFKVPKEVYFFQADSWPRLASGKIDKSRLVAKVDRLSHKGETT